jgi:hypothetical protein
VINASAPTPSSAQASVPAGDAAGTTLTILAPLGINLREGDTSSAPLLATLPQGTVVTVMAQSARNGGWYQVSGDSGTGWIADDPAFSSPGHFEAYASDQRGFSALYPDSWTFMEGPAGVVFGPLTGRGSTITVSAGPSLDALGPAGRPGYSTASVTPVEVYGVTGELRLYVHTSAAPASGAARTAPAPQRLAEVRVTIDRRRAMRIDLSYESPADLRFLRDFYDSIIVPRVS